MTIGGLPQEVRRHLPGSLASDSPQDGAAAQQGIFSRSGAYNAAVIFKRVGEGRPYPDHSTTFRGWSDLPPRQVRLDELVTTKRTLDLEALLAEDSTFYGDLFAHVVEWKGEMYLEDGLHRALRAALHQRPVIHARVLTLDDESGASRLNSQD